MKHYFFSREKRKSFTLVEIMVVVGIMAILLTLSGTNLIGLQNNTYLGTAVTTLVEDIKQQQLKAMTGDTEGRGTLTPYGIHFETNRYILFYSSTYSPSEVSNVAIDLGNNIQITTNTFPQSAVVFQKGSGEVYNFVSGSNTITLKSTNNNAQQIIQINKYGTITNAN